MNGNETERLLRLEQVRMVFHQVPTSVTGTMVGAVLVVTVMWPVLPAWLLLAWLGAMTANQGWRLAFYLRFRRRGLDAGIADRWARYWAAGAGISGLIWGAASILFFVADSPLHQTLLITAVFAITSVAVPLLASHAPSFHAFVFPVLLALIGRNAWEGDAMHLILAFIFTAVMIGVLAVGRKYHELLSDSLRRRFENEALAARLAAQNTELEQARQAAEQASLAKSKFFAAAGHDLRQPLHAMGLFAGALAERARDPEVRRLVDSIGSSVAALEALFNELIDISKIDAGAVRPSPRDFALAPVLERLQADLEPEAFGKGLRLRIHCGEVFLRSDPVLLERILRNLVGNAIRYTERGGVLVGARRHGEGYCVEVWDTGGGIPAEEQGKVFEEFYQIGQARPEQRKGLGLGLSVVRRLAGMLGHPLELRSRVERGTVLRIGVPAGGMPQGVAPSADLLAPTDFSGTLIVVLDDEPAVREGMASLLAGWGAQVAAYAGMDECIRGAKTLPRPPDLVVADHRLRGEATGLEAIRALRAHFGTIIPAIVVTGSTAPEPMEDARALGCHLLCKPVMPGKLRTLVHFKLREGGAE